MMDSLNIMLKSGQIRRRIFTSLVVTAVMALLITPSSANSGPELTLSISERLDNSQLILVSYTGLLPNGDLKIQECARGATTARECGGTTFATADNVGAGNAIFKVTRTNDLDIMVPTAPFLKCDVINLCEIRIFSVDDLTNIVSKNIDFVPGPGGCPLGLPGAITGKGTAALARAFVSWGPVTCEKPVSVSVDYVPESDMFGMHDFKCGLVDFAITDQGLSGNACAESDSAPEIAGLVPVALSGISFAFNIRDSRTGQRVNELNLTSEMLTQIFTGQLATLDVPAIRAINPGIGLPNKLFVGVRADQSAATLAVTSYFHETNPEVFALGGRNNEFASGPMDIFPAISGVAPVTGETKLLASLTNPDPDPINDSSYGWIGYVSSAAAEFGALSSVTIVDSVGGGAVKPTAEAFTAAYEEAVLAADGSYKFDYTPTNPLSYPLTTISSLVVPKLKFGDPRIETFKGFISWVAIEGQDAKYLPRGYAPLPRALSASAIRISQKIGQAAIPSPTPITTPSPTPTPIPSETFLDSPAPDYSSGGTYTDTGGPPNTSTEKVRLSAFSETQAPASPLGRILIFVLLGLFAGSAISSLKTRK
jgi:phosphate transport system substrate-binding protein